MLHLLKIATLIISCSLISTKSSTAQDYTDKSRENWYCGRYLGIDFNSGTPVQTTNGPHYATEGGSTISDNGGNLLFYTDGAKIYNNSHTQMPNGWGLHAGSSVTQNTIIVQNPGDTNQYYVFTLANVGNVNTGLKYSIVDMTLDSGLGDVTASKNVVIYGNDVSQKMTAIRHQNNCDYWIIIHDYDSQDFHSYLLTDSGISATPIVSTLGPHLLDNPANGNLFAIFGQMNPNDDGTQIAVAFAGIADTNRLGLFDFDKSTGQLSNYVALAEGGAPYGVEFSPDGNILYATKNLEVLQYDLTAGSGAAIYATRTVVATIASGSYLRSIQIGTNGKLYIAIAHLKKKLGVINNPDVLGLGCNTDVGGFNISNQGVWCRSVAGLPNFPQMTSKNFMNHMDYCLGQVTSFSSTVANTLSNVAWDFGDPSTGANNTSTSQEPTHLYSDTGYFEVKLIINCNFFADTIIDIVHIIDCTPLPVLLGSLSSECEGNMTELVWSTLSEYNNDYFSIWKYSNNTFIKQADIGAAGTSNEPNYYSWRDAINDENEVVIFKLTQTDFDGTITPLGLQSVKSCNIEEIHVYVNNEGLILISGDNLLSATLFDVLGKRISSTEEVLENNLYLSTNQLTSGAYLIWVIDKNQNRQMFRIGL